MKIHLPACGPELPVHPTTGLTALGLLRNGRPIWPVRGGSGEADIAGDSAEGDGQADRKGDGKDDAAAPSDLGQAGKQAIDRMKAERNAAQAELRGVKEQLEKLAPLQKLADALGGQATDADGKPDIDSLTARLTQHEAELAKERAARVRAEVIAEKQLTPVQAKRLMGSTREELAADADEILRDFPAAAGNGPNRGGPRPDLSQGNRGGAPGSGREAGLAEAKKRFGPRPNA